MKLSQQQVQHLLLRAGFGDNYQTVTDYIGKSPEKVLFQQMALATKIGHVKVNLDYDLSAMVDMTDTERSEMRKQGRKDVKSLNVLWLKEMVSASSGFNEKMAFFWHDHFACRSQNPIFMQQYLDVIRTHALGNFGDLLREVSKSPAMLQYLNNQQNKKKAPNENFAREVMELFTLGRDQGYTERDISEAARAFTGWGFNQVGQFVFRDRQHDDEPKTIFGQTRNYDGDNVLDLLLKQEQTANYISEKWVKYFVNPDGDDELTKEVSKALFQSNYDIKAALQVLFTSPRFYKPENIGVRIKSPIELIVVMQRQLGVRIQDENSLIFLQRMLGQTLFDPPNVSGWPDGKDWVDSASLLFRLRLPEMVFRAAVIQQYPGVSFDDNDQFKMGGRLRKLQCEVDLGALKKTFNDKRDKLHTYLLQTAEVSIEQTPSDLLDQVVFITSKPEYQLC